MPRPPGAPWNMTSAGNGPLPLGLRTAAAMYTPSFALIQVCMTGESASLTTCTYFRSGTASLPPAWRVIAACDTSVNDTRATVMKARMCTSVGSQPPPGQRPAVDRIRVPLAQLFELFDRPDLFQPQLHERLAVAVFVLLRVELVRAARVHVGGELRVAFQGPGEIPEGHERGQLVRARGHVPVVGRTRFEAAEGPAAVHALHDEDVVVAGAFLVRLAEDQRRRRVVAAELHRARLAVVAHLGAAAERQCGEARRRHESGHR